MGFFQTFWTWMNGELASYIGASTARLAGILEPAVVSLGAVYLMVWGYLMLSGRLEEPVTAGLKRILTLAIVLGVGLHLWLYNSVVVDTFYNAPAQLAAQVVGASDPVQTLDAIWSQGGEVASRLYTHGGIMPSGWGFDLAAMVVWALVGLLCIYTMFLLALSSVALSVLLALGPLFIATLLFDSSHRLLFAWLSQLANYALITILTVMVASLMLQLVASYARQTASLGSAIDTVDALDLLLVTVLVFLFMRQIMPIAAGLAGGVALSSFGLVGRSVGWSGRTAVRGAAKTVGPGVRIVSGALGSYALSRLGRGPGSGNAGPSSGLAGAGASESQG